MERISSRRNPLVQQFRAVSGGSNDRVLLDGIHLLEEALASGAAIEVVALGDRAAREGADIACRAERLGARVVAVSDPVLDAMSPVRHPSGIVAIGRVRRATLEEALAGSPQLVLILCDVQDPGNVGSIIRAAEAFGATGVIAGDRTADPFGWKALRGSMGSAFRLPVVSREGVTSAAAAMRARGIHLFAAVPGSGTPLSRCDLRAPSAILFGSEGGGIPPDLIERTDGRLTIPMRPPVESLNVAAAAALVVYEAQRQREDPSG